MTTRTVWYYDDKETPLAELRDRLGFADDDRAAAVDNLNVTMLLCDRLDAALNRIAELETAVVNLITRMDDRA